MWHKVPVPADPEREETDTCVNRGEFFSARKMELKRRIVTSRAKESKFKQIQINQDNEMRMSSSGMLHHVAVVTCSC
jgi:hypothetical protein